MELFLVQCLNGLSAGLLLFMLSAGLTLIFSMLGVLNFAHASFYMWGAYLGVTLSRLWGFVPALLLAPLLVGLAGAAFERWVLRRVRAQGSARQAHVAELLATFGLGFVLLEVVHLVWGRAYVPFEPPAWLQGPAFTLHSAQFPRTRAFMAAVSLGMLGLLWLLLKRTRLGLVIQAALTHPDMVAALGHPVPAIFTGVFGAGCALAALAGVIGGMNFITEPGMAAAMGSILFVVVVVGGLGSLGGALLGSLLVGMLQTLPLAVDASLLDLLTGWGWTPPAQGALRGLLKISLAQAAPLLPYLLLVVMLALRPRGLLGRR